MLKLNRTQLKEWDIAVAFDNGALKSGPSSSIVDFSEGHPRILRAGAISVAEMTEVVPLVWDRRCKPRRRWACTGAGAPSAAKNWVSV